MAWGTYKGAQRMEHGVQRLNAEYIALLGSPRRGALDPPQKLLLSFFVGHKILRMDLGKGE